MTHSQAFSSLGAAFCILRNFFKRHACCRAAFEGIEGLCSLLASRGLTPDDVEQAVVTMRPARMWLVANQAPESLEQAKFSLPFCMALGALYGSAGFPEFPEARLCDPRVLAFMKKVRLVTDAEIPVKARIEVTDRRGATCSAEPVCRSLGVEQVRGKFRANLSGLLDENLVGDILECTQRLDGLPSVGELTGLLSHDIVRRTHA